MRFLDLTGKNFGRLIVVDRARNRGRNVYWACQCSCGKTCEVMGELLRLGKTSSCGCLRTESTKRLKRAPVVDGDVVRIPLTRGQIAVVDLVDAVLGNFNWGAIRGRDTWYGARHGRNPNRKVILLHREVALRAGLVIDGLEVDHRDGDGLNCRRGNLRPATRSQNALNTRRHRATGTAI